MPTFDCLDEDLYTTSDSNVGNKALTYPIGLISADEVVYAGGVYSIDNTDYYLSTNERYFTMSPSSFTYNAAVVFDVSSGGDIASGYVDSRNRGIRPVINLKADIQISLGTGTSTNPYIIS